MIDSILNEISARFYSLFGFIANPFWGWVWLAIAIAAAVVLIVYFFGGWLPVLKPIGGVILLLMSFGLYAYRTGENDQAAIDKKRVPPPRKPAPPMPRWPFQ